MDDLFTTATFMVEREIGSPIMEDYPLMKFFQQLEELGKLRQREQKANEGSPAPKTFGG